MPSNSAGVLAQYGAIGVMLLVVGLFAKTLITREQVRADRLEAEVNRLNSLVQEKTIPALVSATQAIQASQQLLQNMQYQSDVDERAKAEGANGYDRRGRTTSADGGAGGGRR